MAGQSSPLPALHQGFGRYGGTRGAKQVQLHTTVDFDALKRPAAAMGLSPRQVADANGHQ